MAIENEKKPVELDEVVPTLFIAVGGTGAEVLFRIRRRIMNTLWAKGTVRMQSMTEFPLAAFLHVDLDSNTVTETGKAQKSDMLNSAVRFAEDERLVKKLDMSKYTRSDDDLSKYPIIKEWFPLDRKKLNELNIDPEKGAGQIRSLSRLYFFDKYSDIKNAIISKRDALLNNVSTDQAQKRLGLKVKTGEVRIVVVASTAGGTGSGGFIDMGYLSSWLLKGKGTQGSASLVLMLPTGFVGANKSRTEANTYAALMELETCTRQGTRYVKQWAAGEIPRDMPLSPYSDVYLVDTENVASAKTGNITDIYDMLADILFEDFSTADFANKKRSISVNQNQHKIVPYEPPLPAKYGDMKLSFSRGYSAFGQATIDTHLEPKQNIVLFRQVNEMLKAFFGVASNDIKSNLPTETERNEIINNYMKLGREPEAIDYDFVKPEGDFKKGIELNSYPLVTELLRKNNIDRLDQIETNITNLFGEIRNEKMEQWPEKIAELLKQIDRDTFKAVDGGGTHEDQIIKRRAELLDELTDPNKEKGLIKALWARVDNKEKGGLDYTSELVKQIKDRLENDITGLIKALENNAKWFADLSGHLKNNESEELQIHLRQALSKLLGKKDMSMAKLDQIAQATKLYVRYHLYSLASREAVTLLKELSARLGKQTGIDVEGEPIWNGFVGDLEDGRTLVKNIIANAENQIALAEESMKQSHAMYIVLPAPHMSTDNLRNISPNEAKAWAEEVFQDFGGTQILFNLLRTDEGREDLLGKLRMRALSKLPTETESNKPNPLFEALDAHPNLKSVFSDCLTRAMPWVAAKLDGYLKKDNPQDQYKCFIGVNDSKVFQAKYGELLNSCIPMRAKITKGQVGFVEIDTPGKLVCYTELSGLPLPALMGLDQWYVSYVAADIPTHTHKKTSMFVHPRELSLDELASRVEDFTLYLQAVALGVLERSAKEDDNGAYKFKIKGNILLVGDERRRRMMGFQEQHREIIKTQVDGALDKLKTSEQLAAWGALMDYYRLFAYPVASLIVDGETHLRKSLPNLLAGQMYDETLKSLQRKMGESEATALIERMQETLHNWTTEITRSEEDVYLNEINTEEQRPKRVLSREVLVEGWNGMIGAAPVAQKVATVPAAARAATASITEARFRAFINKKQEGPWTVPEIAQQVSAGVMGADTKMWNMAWDAKVDKWQMASNVQELQGLFVPDPMDDEIPDPE